MCHNIGQNVLNQRSNISNIWYSGAEFTNGYNNYMIYSD